MPTLMIGRSNNKLLKNRTNLLLLDKPTSWYTFHENQYSIEAKTFLYNLISKNNDVILPASKQFYFRHHALALILDNTEAYNQVAEQYNLQFVFYITKTIEQFLGVQFEDQKKQVLFKLKYPVQDVRDTHYGSKL